MYSKRKEQCKWLWISHKKSESRRMQHDCSHAEERTVCPESLPWVGMRGKNEISSDERILLRESVTSRRVLKNASWKVNHEKLWTLKNNLRLLKGPGLGSQGTRW